MKPITAENKRLFYLDFIRVNALFFIMLHHYNQAIVIKFKLTSEYIDLDFFENIFWPGWHGIVGVSLFIIISGASLMQSTSNGFTYKKYLTKRFFSIYPLYWLSYLFAALFIVKNFPQPNNYWSAVLTLIGFDGFLLPITPNYYLIGEWFIGFIVILYLLFPLIRWLFLRDQLLAISVLFIITLLSMKYYNFDISNRRFPLCRLLEFGFGINFVLIFRQRTNSINLSLTIISFFLLILIKDIQVPLLFRISLLGISWFLCLASLGSLIDNKHILKLFSFLSSYSFGAFLLHHVIINRLIPLVLQNDVSVVKHLFMISLITITTFSLSFLITQTSMNTIIFLTQKFSAAKNNPNVIR